MTVVLDTDVASELQRDRLPSEYRVHLEGERRAVSFATVGELFKGAYKASWGPARLARMEEWLSRVTVLDYEPAVARVWGHISAEVEKVGRPVSCERSVDRVDLPIPRPANDDVESPRLRTHPGPSPLAVER